MISSWFRFVIEQELADKFLMDLLAELDEKAAR